jgi:hypothetical protein
MLNRTAVTSDITNKQFGIKIMSFDGIHDGLSGVDNGRIRTVQVHIPEPGGHTAISRLTRRLILLICFLPHRLAIL